MKHILKNGIVVEDGRDIQCGVSIKNAQTKYFEITHSGVHGLLLLRNSAKEVDEEDFDIFVKEFKESVKSYRQIKKLLKP